MNQTPVFKALCYPGKAKNVSLETLVRLGHVDGKQILKGRNCMVLDRLWSDVCGFWVVVVGSGLSDPTDVNSSVVEQGKNKA